MQDKVNTIKVHDHLGHPVGFLRKNGHLVYASSSFISRGVETEGSRETESATKTDKVESEDNPKVAIARSTTLPPSPSMEL